MNTKYNDRGYTELSVTDFIIQYAGIMYDRNLKSYGNLVTKQDIINGAISKDCKTREDAIKAVRDVLFFEKRILLATRQQRQNRDLTGEKRCNKCTDNKPVAEFYVRIDSRTGFRYLNNNCKECEKIRRNEYNSKKRQERHAKADIQQQTLLSA